MKVTVVGYLKQEGNFEGRDYHNFQLHTTEPITDVAKGKGLKTRFLKIKMSEWNNIVKLSPDECIGKTFQVSFDEYKNPDQLTEIK